MVSLCSFSISRHHILKKKGWIMKVVLKRTFMRTCNGTKLASLKKNLLL
uniref:Uncharacterized protein n=1 Tax=Anguilla anguilla TaxID=7936 RepID=A0A0E9UFT8_ANGAN